MGDSLSHLDDLLLSITITERRSLVKLFSPSRFSGENVIAHRQNRNRKFHQNRETNCCQCSMEDHLWF